ncbi:SDR family oxidoreductase [Gordonia pseudamarae]|jgi:NAD(P)-dependent dehydrogenase (short-subunit alcohol dehydrogenase family)|uniref:3-oxoacyl-[acyl-carrier-protein] reductase MabA n=1 Tax=Gordonia pseudamarae TaxID=2831662 RepID=A0ABX6IKE9_9ACTN|nr:MULTISPECIES: SDR family oxidoreductase [Gordonia]MBD0023091.1 SDR family oxidoreductase [Gordonia sp. (in: high G+C Gram-positive bacteria)]QHN27223.1 SDR family oxidoreductase [Gordonia pseudamarae]QHN36106.1 SDR family oxidoreductase [Gordonia pseudamarae]
MPDEPPFPPPTPRVALITGAGRGLGATTALRLAADGIAIAVNDLVPARAEESAAAVVAAGGRAVSVPGDITDPATVTRIVDDVRDTLGPIAILVNNAGIPAGGVALAPFAETSPDDWDAMIRLNIYGVLQCTHAVIGQMTELRWGRIITITSDSARTGEARMAVYAASKAAGASLMRSLSKELGRAGITCNTLSLGTIVSAEVAGTDRMLAHAKRYPLRRLGTYDNVASAVSWLVSEDGGWTTGQTIPINGGYTTS